MSRRYILAKAAEVELDNQAEYFAREAGFAVAARFYQAAEDAFRRLAKMPQLGAIRDFGRPHLVGVRMWPIRGFEKHLVFYRPTETGIEVVRVLHSSRDIESLL